MLVRADEKVAQCLMKLKGPEFAPLLDWLKQSLYRTTEDLVSLSGTEVIYRSQGAAKDLKELIKVIEDSSALARKLSN